MPPTLHLSVAMTATAGVNEHHVDRYLTSLFAVIRSNTVRLRVTVTDNSPGLGLGTRLAERFPEIELRSNSTRRGYAANHNAALHASEAAYLGITNDDLEFLPGGLERAVAFLDNPANADVGCVAMQLLNPDRSVQPSTYSFPTIPRVLFEYSGARSLVRFGPVADAVARFAGRGDGRSRFWPHDRTVDIDTCRGAAMIFRRKAAEQVGWLDETTLLGGEDTEWHRRLWNGGWRVVFLHDAPVIHYGSQTLSVNPHLQAEYLKGVLNSFRRHRARAIYVVLRAGVAAVTAARWIVTRLWPRAEARRVAGDLMHVAWRWHPRSTSLPPA